MLLTKHEGETFLNQTVYVSGQAFVRCHFVACTLLLRETVYHLESCSFERCNWHVDVVFMWGSPESVREVKALINMIEQSQNQQQNAGAGAMGMGGGAGGGIGGPGQGLNIPPITRPPGAPPRISSIPPIVPRGDAKPVASAASSAAQTKTG